MRRNGRQGWSRGLGLLRAVSHAGACVVGVGTRGHGLCWVVELARKGQAVRLRTATAPAMAPEQRDGGRGRRDRNSRRRASAPALAHHRG